MTHISRGSYEEQFSLGSPKGDPRPVVSGQSALQGRSARIIIKMRKRVRGAKGPLALNSQPYCYGSKTKFVMTATTVRF